jgi:hypothetical protein
VGSRLPRDVLKLTLGPHASPSARTNVDLVLVPAYMFFNLAFTVHPLTQTSRSLTQVCLRIVSDLKAVDTMSPPDQNGKRKRVDVDLTADDTDTDDLDAPARDAK